MPQTTSISKNANPRLSLITLFIGLIFSASNAQVKDVKELGGEFFNWYNKDLEMNGIAGASVDKAYSKILDTMKVKKEVVVAVIDGGVDIDHEDLVGKIWINSGEVEGDGIDNDNNGYVDDIHGWNFIGSKYGENVHYENMEYTRILRYKPSDDPAYVMARQLYDAEFAKKTKERQNIDKFEEVYSKAKLIIKEATGVDVFGPSELAKVNSIDQKVQGAKKWLEERYSIGFTEEGLKALKAGNRESLDFLLNLDFDARKIVGDDPHNLEDRSYGNSDVKGPRPDHGTSVAGVIAAQRDNEIGIDGVADHVKIMVLRSTPRGDERDKDVALAIFYAVDNGADIINMSFGKDISPEKEFVDQAVRYAEEKGVLMIHAAGNSGIDIEVSDRYPTDRLLDGRVASNWLTVGASNRLLNDEIAAKFSNYGTSHVDLFAPGVNIVSLDSSNTYNMHDGTSLAAPVVSGVAALVLSRFPEFKPQQVIEILMESVFKVNNPKKILRPSLTDEKRKMVRFSEICRSGGILNAYGALQKASEYRAKQLGD